MTGASMTASAASARTLSPSVFGALLAVRVPVVVVAETVIVVTLELDSVVMLVADLVVV